MALAFVLMAVLSGGDPFSEMPVFMAKEGGYDTYRIPGLVVSTKGTALLFCEGRRNSSGDSGDIDLLLRRSFDGGKTWNPVQVVIDDGPNACSNPCPVLDRASGAIFLVFTRTHGDENEQLILGGLAPPCTVWIMKSTDDGATWDAPREVSEMVRKPDWRWYATGPGHGIQLKSGRLLIACNHATAPGTDSWHSHVIYSDDAGATWHIGGIEDGKTDESAVVELSDGRVYHNMRNYRGTHCRAYSTSRDQGMTWEPVKDDPALIEPVCEASLVRLDAGSKPGILFANPAGTKRENLTVRLSYDDCQTWPIAKTLYAGPSAYSDLAVLPDQTILCTYERGKDSPYEAINVARFKVEWLNSAGVNGSAKP